MTTTPGRPEAIVLLGAPGAGKGTLARRLEQAHGFRHVDTGRVLRQRAEVDDPIGRRIAIAQARGLMVPREAVLETLADHLSRVPHDLPLLLDGFPRTTAQVAAADDGRVPVDVTLALWLEVPPDVARSRIAARAGTGARADDAPEVLETRFGQVKETVEAVRALYERRGILETIDASGTPEDVYERALAVLSPLAVAP